MSTANLLNEIYSYKKFIKVLEHTTNFSLLQRYLRLKKCKKYKCANKYFDIPITYILGTVVSCVFFCVFN